MKYQHHRPDSHPSSSHLPGESVLHHKMNYKYKKKVVNLLQVNVVQLLQLLLLLPPVSSLDLAQCRPDQQRQILEEMPGCEARPGLVDLRALVQSNLSLVEADVVQVVPNHVSLPRCGGSCFAPSHSCSPTTMSWTSVDVMLVRSKWPYGEHEVLCTELQVEVHLQCQCGCQLQEEHCSPLLQYYHPPSCRCLCKDTDARSLCLAADKVWDPSSCQCHCPSYRVHHCSSGYTYSHSSCSCVSTWTLGDMGLMAGLGIITVSMVVTLVAGLMMFRGKRGPFQETSDKTSTNTDQGFNRTRLMTQRSRSEFDLVKGLTVREFDNKRRTYPFLVRLDNIREERGDK